MEADGTKALRNNQICWASECATLEEARQYETTSIISKVKHKPNDNKVSDWSSLL